MKRRGFLKTVGVGSVVSAIPMSVFGHESPEMRVGTDHMERYTLSSDVGDFKIMINKSSRVIDITPLDEYKPHLTVLALHRHLCDLTDRMWTAEADLLDITDDTITSRSTDVTINMLHGWTLTQRAKETLVGGISEDGVDYCTVQVFGAMDYDLTRNIKVTTDDGMVHPYHKAGYARVPIKSNENITFTCESYKNVHHGDDYEILHGVWVPQEFAMNGWIGVVVMAMFSTG